MKKVKKIAAVLLILIGFTNLKAQNATPTTPNAVEKPILTADQKVLWQTQREQAMLKNEAFKKTLSAEQLAILDNKDLEPKAKQKALAKTLTDEQKSMMKENRANAKELRENFKKTLTDEQREQIRNKFQSMDKKKLKENISDYKNGVLHN